MSRHHCNKINGIGDNNKCIVVVPLRLYKQAVLKMHARAIFASVTETITYPL